MGGKLTAGNRALLAVLALAALAAGFWLLVLSPRRERAAELGKQVANTKAALAQHELEVSEAEAARGEFAAEYRRLVVLGKAVPPSDEVASLLVQLQRISERAGGAFRDLTLNAGGEGGGSPAPAAGSGSTPASATEAAASLLPLGATVGPAGLAVMPYDVTFDGNFFQIADFIKGIDSLVETDDGRVRVDGRLVTIDGFSLAADPDRGFPHLQASFSLRTYLTPPGGEIAPPAPGAEVSAVPASSPAEGSG